MDARDNAGAQVEGAQGLAEDRLEADAGFRVGAIRGRPDAGPFRSPQGPLSGEQENPKHGKQREDSMKS